ncbi:putative quinol monooxygenase [Periweissella beninensis]|uniref:Antibiotic biosynthesis monooxygenase n=1 Tax=Periweissella beninensis TaxID=504936 RepID=A0ABT0VMY2_9LACO|nr:putative quinol monooxygenase [Periweissella beninensis]MBM7544265.1 quinol monooxygenase YgiN [Periweissella beninensis]MCM2437767.1 antibiotic biosynthesis monooxygenase [Periweissella beninensis]MCT4396422.1 antibiotic biosynthesis monooxygenase [Periweissella beninensis]
MEVINVELQVKDEKRADYEKFVRELVNKSLAEKGNLAYAHFKKIDCQDTYEIIEHWRDQAAVATHNETAHFKRFLSEINDYLVTPPAILRMTAAS